MSPRRLSALVVAFASAVATACGAPVTRRAVQPPRQEETIRVTHAAILFEPSATIENEPAVGHPPPASTTESPSPNESPPPNGSPPPTNSSSPNESPPPNEGAHTNGPGAGRTVVIAPAHDPDGLARTAPIRATIERTLGREGFTAGADGGLLLSPTINSLVIATGASSATISCKVTLRIAPYAGDVERWEPNQTASATGEAQATTSAARAQIALGINDCFEGAVRAAAARELIPFLRRIRSEIARTD